MVQKPDIQYVTQFYSYGSEAKVPELKPVKKKQQKFALPVAKPVEKIRIAVDPVALAGILIAVVMVIAMAVSVRGYLDTCDEYRTMTKRVIALQNINFEKQRDYKEMYNLDDIREKALALGMIPLEDAQVITIAPTIPEPEPEQSWWENISWFMKGLFA